jgi:hypothetical protein
VVNPQIDGPVVVLGGFLLVSRRRLGFHRRLSSKYRENIIPDGEDYNLVVATDGGEKRNGHCHSSGSGDGRFPVTDL